MVSLRGRQVSTTRIDVVQICRLLGLGLLVYEEITQPEFDDVCEEDHDYRHRSRGSQINGFIAKHATHSLDRNVIDF